MRASIITLLVPLVLACGVAQAQQGAYYSDYILESQFRAKYNAAKEGDADAQYDVAGMYLSGRGVPKDHGEALKWLRKAVDQGHAKAQYKLGSLYMKGEAVEQSDAKAIKWFKAAAKAGYAPAQYNLGRFHADGRGTERDYGAALAWLKKAKANGHARAGKELPQVQAAKRKAEAEAEARREARRRAQQRRQQQRQAQQQAQQQDKPSQSQSQQAKAQESQQQTSSSSSGDTGQGAGEVRSHLLAHSWENGHKPARELPSALNFCDDKDLYVQCRTRKFKDDRHPYYVQSILQGFGSDGSFDLAYRRKVFAKDTDGDGEVDGRWSRYYRYDCELDSNTRIVCEGRDGTREFIRRGS